MGHLSQCDPPPATKYSTRVISKDIKISISSNRFPNNYFHLEIIKDPFLSNKVVAFQNVKAILDFTCMVAMILCAQLKI